MKHSLNPNVETFFLLFNSNWGKKPKKEAIEQLDNFGINGAAFYAAHCLPMEQYHLAFGRRVVTTEGTSLFEDIREEQTVVLLFLSIILLYPEWLEDFDAVPDDEVLTVVHEIASELLEDKDIIKALETGGFSDQTKWQITALLQQPKQRLGLVIDAVQANRGAFEYAYSELESEIDSLITQLEKQIERNTLPTIGSQTLAFNPDTQIIPTMATPFGIIGFDSFTIYGLLANSLLSGADAGLTQSEATLMTKALSDPSKMEILFALKKKELYSLEIAQLLGLTPATTSHHMNLLLSAGLVEVSKKDGKAYYSLSTESIKRYQDWLGDSFL